MQRANVAPAKYVAQIVAKLIVAKTGKITTTRRLVSSRQFCWPKLVGSWRLVCVCVCGCAADNMRVANLFTNACVVVALSSFACSIVCL